MSDYICAQDCSGHRLGTYYVSKLYPVAYIPIMKNASTWAKLYFENMLKWEMNHDDCARLLDSTAYNLISTLKWHRKIVILRDPIERWITGILQYIVTYYPNFDYKQVNDDSLIEYLFTKIYFDEHTLPQVNFLHNQNIDSIDFFNLDNNLSFNLQRYLSDKIPSEFIPIPDDLYKNSTDTNKMQIDLDLRERLRTFVANPYYKNKLVKFYRDDYELISNVKFL